MATTTQKAADGEEISTTERPVSKNLETKEWYHGMRPRKDIIPLLHEPGDFLVRATDGASACGTELILSMMDDTKKITNCTIKRDGGKWFLGTAKDPAKMAKLKRSDTVVDLIEFYMNGGNRKLNLRRPVPRPQWLIKHDQVTFDAVKDRLGSGNFCNVFKGKYNLSTETKIVAVKISNLPRRESASAEETKNEKEARHSMLHEANIMSYYSHANVITFFGVACDHPPVMIVVEYCPGGDLVSHLQKQGDAIDVSERIIYCYESAKGMMYLHAKNCVHRDLAARNCLISDKGTIKIADFGLSKVIQDCDQKDGDVEETSQIPLRWTAPECIRSKAVDRKYSTKSDVWSYGVLLYEIFTNGTKPWTDDPNKFIATQIRRGNMPSLPEKTPKTVKDLVAKMWQVDPTKRPTMREIALQLRSIQGSMPIPDEKLTVNQLSGVKREECDDDSTDFDDDMAISDDQKGNAESKISKKRKSKSRGSRTGRTQTQEIRESTSGSSI